MEPLYTTQFAYTLEEYTKFNMEVMKTQKKIKILNIILTILSILIGALNYYANKSIILSFIVASIPIISVFIIVPFCVKKEIKKVYYSNQTLDKNISNYEFFENGIKETDLHSINSYKYSELTKIIETKTNFYLMIDNAQGYIIVKNNCSPELISFLSELKNKIK